MKTFTKTLFAASALFAVSAQAGPVDIKIYDNATTSHGVNFVDSLFQVVASEDFDTLSDLDGLYNGGEAEDGGTDQSSWVARSGSGYIDTKVGKFSIPEEGGPGWGGTSNPFNTELMIENSDTGEYGRKDANDADGFWLDSNDAKLVNWDFTKPEGGSFNTVGFYLSDAADVGATLTLEFDDGTVWTSDPISGQTSGNLKFVTITSETNILGGRMTFNNNGKTNDGWGIDNVTLGKVPEPGTLLLMGLGLLGLGAARRRAAK